MREEPLVKILGVCGSLQARSSNLALLQAAARLVPEGSELVLFEGLRELPHFDPDLEAEGTLPAVDAWRAALAASDAVLIASPEFGHSLPGSLKNAIDWVIGTAELERKVVAITASTLSAERGRRGLAALRAPLGAVSARVVGGEPLVRGPRFDADLRALLEALVTEARVARSDALT